MMARILSDKEIEDLLKKKKLLPKDWRRKFNLKNAKTGRHYLRNLPVKVDKETFIIKCRQNSLNPLDFSIILCYFAILI